MENYCFVQARFSSRRLKGKVLKKIGKYTLLEILIKRLKKSKKINKIIVLTSTSRSDKKIIKLCNKIKISYFAGPLNNVFLRFKKAIKKYKPKKIIRISADSPLMDWNLIDKMIDISIKKKKFDIITNVYERSYPKGQSIEILNTKLFNINDNLLNDEQREHVTKYFYNKKKFKILNVKLKNNYSNINLCVDELKDYLFISKLIKKKGIFASWKKYAKKKK